MRENEETRHSFRFHVIWPSLSRDKWRKVVISSKNPCFHGWSVNLRRMSYNQRWNSSQRRYDSRYDPRYEEDRGYRGREERYREDRPIAAIPARSANRYDRSSSGYRSEERRHREDV